LRTQTSPDDTHHDFFGPAEAGFERTNGLGTVGGDASTPSIGFALSSHSNGAVVPPELSGLVRGMSFKRMETVLIAHFAAAEPAQAVATARTYRGCNGSGFDAARLCPGGDGQLTQVA